MCWNQRAFRHKQLELYPQWISKIPFCAIRDDNDKKKRRNVAFTCLAKQTTKIFLQFHSWNSCLCLNITELKIACFGISTIRQQSKLNKSIRIGLFFQSSRLNGSANSCAEASVSCFQTHRHIFGWTEGIPCEWVVHNFGHKSSAALMVFACCWWWLVHYSLYKIDADTAEIIMFPQTWARWLKKKSQCSLRDKLATNGWTLAHVTTMYVCVWRDVQ